MCLRKNYESMWFIHCIFKRLRSGRNPKDLVSFQFTMEPLRLGRAVVRMGFFPGLLTNRREAVTEQAIWFPPDEEEWALKASSCCLWEYRAVYRQASCEFGMLSVNRNWTHHISLRIFISRGHRREKLFEYYIRTCCTCSVTDQLSNLVLPLHTFVQIHSRGCQRRLECTVVLFKHLTLKEKLI